MTPTAGRKHRWRWIAAACLVAVLGLFWALPSFNTLCGRFDSSDLCTERFDVHVGAAHEVPSDGLNPTHTIALSPDGTEAAVVLADVTELATGLFIVDLETGTVVETIVEAVGGNYVRAPAWSPDGSRLAAAVSLDGELATGQIMQWDRATGEQISSAAGWSAEPGDDLSAAEFFWIDCRDFGMAFSLGGTHVACMAKAVDFDTGAIRRSHEIGDFLDYGVGRSFVTGATVFSPDEYIAPLRYDISDDDFPYRAHDHSVGWRPVTGLGWSPAAMAMHPSQDGVLQVRRTDRSGWLPRWVRPWGEVRIVDVQGARTLFNVALDTPVVATAWTHDGTRAILATADATLYVLDLGSTEGDVLQLANYEVDEPS